MTSNMLSCLSFPQSAGPDNDPRRNGFQATSLDSDEVVKLLDACIHQDHFNVLKVAAMVLLGTLIGDFNRSQGQVMLLLLAVAQQILT